MALPKSKSDREYKKFVENPNGNVAVRTQSSGFSATSNSTSVTETDPNWNQHLEETLADITNETSGTTTERYIDMDGWRKDTVQFEVDSATDVVTLTLEATLQDDGTAPASITDWQAITQYGCTIQTAASTAGSYVDDVITSIAENSNFKWLMLKTVISGGTNDADYRLYNKKVY